jgi:hypothetical protein
LLTLAAGAGSIACIAATSQVWSFAVPRTAFLHMSLNLFMCTIFGAALGLVFEFGGMKSSLTNPETSPLIITMYAVCVAMLLAAIAVYLLPTFHALTALVRCGAHPEIYICNASAEDIRMRTDLQREFADFTRHIRLGSALLHR